MAKQSMIEREKKRMKFVTKYSERRRLLLLEFKKANTFTKQMETHKKIETLTI